MTPLSKKTFSLSVIALMAIGITTAQNKAIIQVDASRVEQQITPYLYGSCTEDVNHEIYGGLYDQRIFGESFEEPAPNPLITDFSTCGRGEDWTVRGNELWTQPKLATSKLVYTKQQLGDKSSVEVDFTFRKQEDYAGLILFVSRAGGGSEDFYGYEIRVRNDGKQLVIGKQKGGWTHLQEHRVYSNPDIWNTLRAEINGQKVEVFLNGTPITSFTNDDPQMQHGYAALKVGHSKIGFRNFRLISQGERFAPDFTTTPSLPISFQWAAYQQGNAQARYAVDTTDAYNGKNSQVIEMISESGSVGVTNAGLNRWGIAVRKGQKFQGRLYLKTANYKGVVTVALQSGDGKTEYGRQILTKVGAEWGKHPFTLTSNADDPTARLVISIDQPGQIKLDQVSLFSTGKDQFKGLPLRADIGQAFIDQKLTFLRYGGSMINAPEYRFKKMIGDPDKRSPYRGTWYPYSTNGFGIEEFVQFCEAAGFTSAFAVNIEESPEDMADMVEYLNGPESSKWGKIRAQNGHPKPYGVKYISIGNEEVLFNGDRADEYDHYIERFLLLHKAITSKDPSIQLINAAWWRPYSPNMERVFKALDGKAAFWDYHPWADALTSGKGVAEELNRMKNYFMKWNPNTTMKCAIFEENGFTHNMGRVLGHVTLQNAVRRMGDFVFTSCPANALQPFLQNDNNWDQGQIFFTPSQVWGMPPYYAQQMASENHQPLLVHSSITDSNDQLDVTATRSTDGKQVVLHIANTGDKAIDTQLDIEGIANLQKVTAITLAGKPSDRNTLEEPTKIIPVTKQLSCAASQTYTIAPYSYTILIYAAK